MILKLPTTNTPYRMKNKQLKIPDQIIAPYLNIQEILAPFQYIKKISEQMQAFQTSFSKNLAEINKSLVRLNSLKLRALDYPFQDFYNQISYIGKLIKENCDKTPQSLLLLAQYGWYLDFDSEIWLPNKLSKLLEENKIDEVDEYLIDYYSSNLDRFFNEISDQYPLRKNIFNEILSSHKQKMYYVSIPCLLAQVDGICHDSTTKKFFLKVKKNNWLPEIAEEFSNISNSVVEMFLSPILNHTPINDCESALGKYPVHLNRHEILHGVDLTYGIEKNSLKCLSLLKYFSDILSNMEKEVA
jgi:hypothetical protein